ncbi:hypothetical protein ANCDUO_18286 [Ancylostoma duodenale]|uniref:Uncharacterized protein n=1 Tax=Ancylostoma duodenale TaxID=51022 RepID=A0A0C2CPB5_9BILA|nr:hypothetical protein ANCDUO_18286 [Ancylostoma duodenale]
MELATDVVLHLHDRTVKLLQQVNPLLLTSATVVSTYSFVYLWNLHRDDIGIRRRLLRRFFSIVKCVPWVKRKINEEISNIEESLHKTIHEHDGEYQFLTELPTEAIQADQLIKLVQDYSGLEGPRYLEGKVSGAVFNDEKDMEEMRVYEEVFKKFAWSNPLWPKLFPGVRKMEAEVIRMCCTLMHGDEESCGTAAWVIPTSAHAAFTKAAEVFRIRAVRVPVDPHTFQVDLKKMKSAITRRTCMLVGSAPNFPFGTMDDIVAIGKLGLAVSKSHRPTSS